MRQQTLEQISAEARGHFEAAMGGYARIGFDPKSEIGAIWGWNIERFLARFIRDATSPVTAIGEVSARGFYDFNCPPPILVPAVRWYMGSLARHYGVRLADLPPQICESELVAEQCRASVDGRTVSSDFLHRLEMALHLERNGHLVGVERIVELGGGYGSLARTLQLRKPDVRYVIVDLPESLFFAECFLRHAFPEKQCIYVTDKTDATRIENADIALVPTGFVGRLESIEFDLAINTNSLGEMARPVGRRWVEWLEGSTHLKRVCSLNRFLNRVNHALISHRAEAWGCNFLWGSNWTVREWEVNPPFERCPYYMSVATRNLLLVMDRTTGAAPFDAAVAVSRLSDIALEDWHTRIYRDSDLQIKFGASKPPMMSKVYPDLTPDLGPNGPLFGLWEMRRHGMKRETLEPLVSYLTHLGGADEPFEEMYYLTGSATEG